MAITQWFIRIKEAFYRNLLIMLFGCVGKVVGKCKAPHGVS